MEKEAEELRYNMFLRHENPSIFRLAAIQLINEGVDLTDKSKQVENWNKLLDRVKTIINAITSAPLGQETEIKKLYKNLINFKK